MARAVIGGLVTSTILTLLVVPVVYTWLDDFWGVDAPAVGRKEGGTRMRTFLGDGSRRKGLIFIMWILRLLVSAGRPFGPKSRNQDSYFERSLQIADERNKDIQRAKEYRHQVEGRYIEERAAASPAPGNGRILRSRDESQKGALRGALPFEGETWSVDVSVSSPLYLWENRGGHPGGKVRSRHSR